MQDLLPAPCLLLPTAASAHPALPPPPPHNPPPVSPPAPAPPLPQHWAASRGWDRQAYRAHLRAVGVLSGQPQVWQPEEAWRARESRAREGQEGAERDRAEEERLRRLAERRRKQEEGWRRLEETWQEVHKQELRRAVAAAAAGRLLTQTAGAGADEAAAGRLAGDTKEAAARDCRRLRSWLRRNRQ